MARDVKKKSGRPRLRRRTRRIPQKVKIMLCTCPVVLHGRKMAGRNFSKKKKTTKNSPAPARSRRLTHKGCHACAAITTRWMTDYNNERTNERKKTFINIFFFHSFKVNEIMRTWIHALNLIRDSLLRFPAPRSQLSFISYSITTHSKVDTFREMFVCFVREDTRVLENISGMREWTHSIYLPQLLFFLLLISGNRITIHFVLFDSLFSRSDKRVKTIPRDYKHFSRTSPSQSPPAKKISTLKLFFFHVLFPYFPTFPPCYDSIKKCYVISINVSSFLPSLRENKKMGFRNRHNSRSGSTLTARNVFEREFPG